MTAKSTSHEGPRKGRQFEPANETESDEKDYQPLVSRRTAGKIPAVTLRLVQPKSLEAGDRPAGHAIESKGETKSVQAGSKKQETADAAKNTRLGKERKTTQSGMKQRRTRYSKTKMQLRCKQPVRLREEPAEQSSEIKNFWFQIRAKTEIVVLTIRLHA